MRLFKQIAAGVLVTWGLVFTIAGVTVPFDSTEDDPVSTFAGCMMLGLPPLVWGFFIYRGLSKEQKKARINTETTTINQVQETFFRLLESNNGELTLMRFAMETRLPAEEAREFLDEAAGQFNASFRVGDRGEIYYQFPIGDLPPNLPPGRYFPDSKNPYNS
ncbi:MAG: hypothetical protein AAF685_11065 [Cyanobacteria bacterium P01_C01_bin.89]